MVMDCVCEGGCGVRAICRVLRVMGYGFTGSVVLPKCGLWIRGFSGTFVALSFRLSFFVFPFRFSFFCSQSGSIVNFSMLSLPLSVS